MPRAPIEQDEEKSDAADIAKRIDAMQSAYRDFQIAAQEIAKRQSALLRHVQELIDQNKLARLRKGSA